MNSNLTRHFFSPSGFWQDPAVSITRIVIGLFMIYHGFEIFDARKMSDYEVWMKDMDFSHPGFLSYAGKAMELGSGILLVLGLFTRLALLFMAVTMAMICFGLGKGRIFMEDQHPFLFLLMAFVLFFTGPGKWSLDQKLFHSLKN